MYHVTDYCNVIGLHCTVRRDKACIHIRPFPFAEVGLACESNSMVVELSQVTAMYELTILQIVLVSFPLVTFCG